MSSPFQPNDRASAPRPDSTSPPPKPDRVPAEPSLDLGVLKQLLDETLSSTAPSASASDSVDLATLRAVALACADQPFGLSVAIELIVASLRGQFSQPAISAAELHAMATQIAGVLCDDPVSRARLEALWERLRKQSA